MAIILPITDSLQLGRSYTARLCLISGCSSSPPIQPLPLPALSLFGPITSSTAPINSLQICCSGGHHTTLLLRRPSHNSAVPAAISRLLLLRRPSHNYCCSGGRCITAALPAIALWSSSSSIFGSTTDIVFSSLDATVSTSR